jgi:hypothetical protein
MRRIIGIAIVTALSLAAAPLFATGPCQDVCIPTMICNKQCLVDGQLQTCGEWGTCDYNRVYFKEYFDCHCVATARPYVWRVIEHYRDYNWYYEYLWCSAHDAGAGEYNDGDDCLQTHGCVGFGDPGPHC